jgi:hypothetical protein
VILPRRPLYEPITIILTDLGDGRTEMLFDAARAGG